MGTGWTCKKKLKEEQQILIEINAKLKLQFEAANKAEYELRTPVEQNKKETQTKTNTNKDLVAQALEYESKHSFWNMIFRNLKKRMMVRI